MSDDISPKTKITAEELAQVIAREYILSDTRDAQPGLVIDEKLKPHFTAKTMSYRLALALMAMMAEEEKNPNVLDVRTNIEMLFFMPHEKTEDLLAEVRVAMKKLNDLLFSPERKEFTWGITWFDEIGIDETDPINLTLFAMKWMNQYKLVNTILRECEIIGSPGSPV